VYLNLVADTTEIKAYHRPAVSRFIAEMREAVPGLPDFSDSGLNSAWSMMQGESQRVESTREKDGCKNEACIAPETENSNFRGRGAARRVTNTRSETTAKIGRPKWYRLLWIGPQHKARVVKISFAMGLSKWGRSSLEWEKLGDAIHAILGEQLI
jgi:hypothetical protein